MIHIFHDYKIVKVQMMKDSDNTPITLVWKKCWCGKIKEKKIRGNWDFTDLTGLPQKELGNMGNGIFVEEKDLKFVKGPVEVSVSWNYWLIFKKKYPKSYKKKLLTIISEDKFEECEKHYKEYLKL